MDKVKSFIQDVLEVEDDLDIQVAHRIGGGDNRPMIARFKNTENKVKLFKKVGNLKDKTNVLGKNYFVNNQMPA